MALLLEFEPNKPPHCPTMVRSAPFNGYLYGEKLKNALVLDAERMGLVQGCQYQSVEESGHHLAFSLPLFCNTLLIFRITGQAGGASWRLTASLMQRDRPVSPRSSEILRNICRTLRTINTSAQRSLVYFTAHPGNGLLRLQLHHTPSPNTSTQSTFTHLRLLISDTVKMAKCFSAILLHICNELPHHELDKMLPESSKSWFYGANGEHTKFADLKQLLLLTNCARDNTETQSFSERKERKSRNSIKNARRIIDLGLSQQLSIQKENILFAEPPLYRQSVPVNTDFSQDYFRKHLTFPEQKYKELAAGQSPIANNSDFFCIYNTIFVSEVQMEKEKVVGEGGKAQLIALPMKISYCPSIDSREVRNVPKELSFEDSFSQMIDEPKPYGAVLQRSLLVKVPKQRASKERMDEIKYEKYILKTFRCAKSLYLAKYYHSEQISFPYRDCLLLDYIAAPTLHDELSNKRHTISGHSKLTVLAHLSNAVRFIQGYQVSHLDISPNNVLVGRDNVAKLIDFGEAYHPQLTKQFENLESSKQKKAFRYSPGKTYPYAPPETSSRNDNFSSQQDVFSVGMLLFRLVFGYVPLNLNQRTFQKLYRKGEYLSRIMFAPQQGEHLASRQFMNIAVNLIFKCLQVQEQLRPLPIWLNIILNKLVATLR